MSQIDIKIIKQSKQQNSKKYVNVLSCSFFTMTDAYRDFSKYQKNLETLIQYSLDLPDFELRIYTDNTGIEFAQKVSKDYDHITILQFKCEALRENNGHVGTFGTLVRFLPMFEKKLKIVWVTDIDIPKNYLDINKIKEMKRTNSKVYFSTYLCYENKVYGRKHTILAGTMIYSIKFPIKLLTNFIQKYINNKYESVIKILNNTKKPSKFPYGLDEVFINTYIYDYIQKKNINCYVNKLYDATNYIKYNPKITKQEKDFLTSYYFEPSKDKIEQLKKIYKKYIPDLISKYPCLQELLDKIDMFKDRMEENIITQL
jgi:hypothetical protein